MKILQAGACALALCVGAMAAAPVARAQPFGFFEDGPFRPRVFMPEADDWGAQGERRRVRRALEAQGYELMGPLARRGRTFEARVEDMRGQRLRVIVDARSGEVIERFGLRGALEGPPRPPRNVGPDRFERVKPFDRFGPRLNGPDFDAPPFSAMPAPQERRVAPTARKPAPRQARKPDEGRQARPAPAPAPAQQQAARPAPDPSPAPQSGAPAASSPAQASAPAAEAAGERNANLRRPDVAQRTPPQAASESAPARPAPRVVYPGPATSTQRTE